MTQQQNYSHKNHTDLEWGGGLWVKHALKGKNSKHHGEFMYIYICISFYMYILATQIIIQQMNFHAYRIISPIKHLSVLLANTKVSESY